jgi:hypothetical protein
MSNIRSDGWIHAGLTYAEYLASWRETLLISLADLDKDARKLVYYARYNIERHDRIRDTYRPSDRLIEAGEAVQTPQIWLMLTEDWCVDSSYALPAIAAAAQAANAELRIMRRDEHPDVMDAYLTNGTRSIPKLVAFDMNGNELFQWGSRPEALVRQREEWVSDGRTKGEMSAAAAEWYESDNLASIDAELAELVLSAAGVPIS